VTDPNPAMRPRPAAPEAPAGLRRVVAFLLANLTLSTLLTIAVFALRRSVVDYELAHTHVAPGVDVAVLRRTLENAVWLRVGGVLLVSVVYAFLIRRLRAGSRNAYRRVTWISALGIVAIALALVQGRYPVWMRAEQVLQGAVLAGLLWSTQQADVKRFFAKPA
jgi:hypothetical protein